MPNESELKAEIGHVLLIDIVGYSKLLINQQGELLQTLKQLVQETEPVREARSKRELIRLPTGDGMALIFRNNLEAPLECALQLSAALRDHSELSLRMGIHSGPICEVRDVNERVNVAGAGIDMAQRVMDCGDAGHILLSKRAAEDLAPYPRWNAHLHDLGETEVKHGVRLHLFNLYSDKGGNPAFPSKLESKTPATAPDPGRSSERWLLPTAALLLLFSLGGAVWWLVSRPGKATLKPAAVQTAPVIPEKSIAVLPFENLSSDKENAYFAEGVQDEILTKLAGIADLKVISRTSTEKYQSKPDDLKTISRELGVANVLEGTVQRANEKVRVNVQLIDARADSHVWARTFDGNAGEVFAVESKVAQEVADSLQAKLSPAEANKLATAPTRDAVAYDLFLKGEYEARLAANSLKAESFDQAAAWYQQAIERDPSFALAIARLVRIRMLRSWFIEPFTEAQLAEVKALAEHALTLQPNLSEAHIALGTYYYYGFRQYEEALTEFSRALRLEPNNAQAVQYLGFVHRRQGRLQIALEELTKALEQDPRDVSLAANRADIFIQWREWAKAQPALRAGIAIDPHEVLGMRGLLLSILNGSGDTHEALRVLASYPPESKLVTNSTIGDITGITGDGTYTFVLARDYPAALKLWENSVVSTAADGRRQLAALAAIHLIAGDFSGAQTTAEKARPILEQRLSERQGEILTRTELSWVYLALKRNADAMKLAQQSAALLPPEKDLLVGYHILAGEAMIASQAGATSDAVGILRGLLSVPAGQAVSIARLRIDPVWDPIRHDPGFQQLLAGKELIGPPQ
jgi:TolB-like protein/Tfp pilus assembly protein PilF